MTKPNSIKTLREGFSGRSAQRDRVERNQRRRKPARPWPKNVNPFTGQRIREAPRGAPADETAANELVLYIENTSDLSPDGPRGQGRDVLLNALRKWRKGTYDPTLAAKLFGYLVESGAKRYAKEFGSSEREWSTMFPPATRQEAARQLEASFRNSAERGEYDKIDTHIGGVARGMRESGGIGEVIESRRWRNRRTGATASPYGASPWTSDRERSDWDLETVGWTIRWADGRVGTGRLPFASREEAQDFLDRETQRRAEARARLAPSPEPVHSSGRRRARRAHESSRSDDRPISMTYGQLPPFEEFEQDIRRPDPDNKGRPYWPEFTLYPMELARSREIELAERYGLDEFRAERSRTGRNTRVRGFQGDERQIYGFLEYLVEQHGDGDDEAGDLASSIMTTLGYEWI